MTSRAPQNPSFDELPRDQMARLLAERQGMAQAGIAAVTASLPDDLLAKAGFPEGTRLFVPSRLRSEAYEDRQTAERLRSATELSRVEAIESLVQSQIRQTLLSDGKEFFRSFIDRPVLTRLLPDAIAIEAHQRPWRRPLQYLASREEVLAASLAPEQWVATMNRELDLLAQRLDVGLEGYGYEKARTIQGKASGSVRQMLHGYVEQLGAKVTEIAEACTSHRGLIDPTKATPRFQSAHEDVLDGLTNDAKAEMASFAKSTQALQDLWQADEAASTAAAKTELAQELETAWRDWAGGEGRSSWTQLAWKPTWSPTPAQSQPGAWPYKNLDPDSPWFLADEVHAQMQEIASGAELQAVLTRGLPSHSAQPLLSL